MVPWHPPRVTEREDLLLRYLDIYIYNAIFILESSLRCLHLETMEQLNALKESFSVGEKRIRYVKIISTNSEQETILQTLPMHVAQLDCSRCESLTNTCFAALVNLIQLNCSHCKKLTAGCFDGLLNLTELDCLHCKGLTNCCFEVILKQNLKRNHVTYGEYQALLRYSFHGGFAL